MRAAKRSRVPAIMFAAVGILLVALTGRFLVSFVTEHGVHYERERLKVRARAVATALDVNSIAALTGQPEDEGTPAFRSLVARLTEDRKTHREVRFNYLMGWKNGAVVFLLDTADPASSDYSPPGEVYEEASPELVRSFTTGEPFVEGPIADRWGTWVSGMAPIRDSSSGRIIAVMGMDVDATRWRVTVGACRAFAYVIIGSLVWMIIFFSRRVYALH